MFLRRKKTTGPEGPVEYPSGTCVKAPSGLWYITGGKRYKITSDRILRSWSFPRVAQASDENLSDYKPAGRLGFRNNSLLFNLQNAKMYLVVDNQIRQVNSPDVLTKIGASFDDAVVVSPAELKLHSEGESLD